LDDENDDNYVYEDEYYGYYDDDGYGYNGMYMQAYYDEATDYYFPGGEAEQSW
jgi:hypothetical protein